MRDTEHDWRHWAACVGTDPELFFLGTGDEGYGEAFRICARCPVREQCLAESVQIMYGVYGGTSARERARLRKPRQVRCGTYSGYERHRRFNEEICGPCRAAKRAYRRRLGRAVA